jgi:hypothetical protein
LREDEAMIASTATPMPIISAQVVKALKESTYFHTLMSDRALTPKSADVALGSKYYDA